ncbi:unnamed protein product [Paramecium pentaurelia]|uniref:Uncharacterized protein n=1 Tax=Paramecium pentaurelia TaxID=43138 RepID=A0A8S1X4S6_9CILI|nr:unnamed protein product [Paramecium pentaurelia]
MSYQEMAYNILFIIIIQRIQSYLQVELSSLTYQISQLIQKLGK